MTLAELSVRRPVLAWVGVVVLCLFGTVAFLRLPVRELPAVDPPVVSVQTQYVGASAEVVETRVTELVEKELAGLQGVDRVNSSSRDGLSAITVTFTLGRDLEAAANDVRDAVARVAAQLPADAKPPQIQRSSADATAAVFLGLTSDRMNRLQLVDYANRYIVPRLSTLPGAGYIGLAGAGVYAMRIWLQPEAMAARGVTVQDVEAALAAHNRELPAGSLEGDHRDVTVRLDRSFETPQGFADLPVRVAANANPAPGPASAAPERPIVQSGAVSIVRLGDIARIEESALERRTFFEQDGQTEVGMSVSRQAQANDLEISRAAHRMVAEINRGLPPGTRLQVVSDYTEFTSAAIRDVWITLALALAAVAAVNLLFLGSWRAAVIPAVVAPVCLVGAFIALAAAGFSINLLTLLALVLAIGLVVDDAIMVVENIQRRVDDGEPPRQAAERGARQVFFAVVATTAVLIAAFAPLLILPGYTGRLFVELAATVIAAVFVSAVLALSLSPMLASRLLVRSERDSPLSRRVRQVTAAAQDAYRDALRLTLGRRHAGPFLAALLLALSALAGGLALALPKALVPPEDRGRVDVSIQGPEGGGFDDTVRAAREVEDRFEALRRQGLTRNYVVTVPPFGNGVYNTGIGSAVLVDWSRRKVSADEVAAQLSKTLAGITTVRATAGVRGPFQRGGGTGASANVDFIVSGDDYGQIDRWIAPIFRAAQANPGLSRPRLDYRPTAPRLAVRLDEARAAALGVPDGDVGEALQVLFGSKQVTTYLRHGEEYYVDLQADRGERRTLADLDRIYLRTMSGGLTPLSGLVKTAFEGDVAERLRVDRLRSITISSELNPGYTVGQAVQFYRDQAARQPAQGLAIRWGGQAKDYLEASNALGWAMGLSLLMVFLALAAQFESWIQPAVIILTVPLAALGGLSGLALAGGSLNLYSEIGLMILVGLAAKNGVLIVEFANQLRGEGRGLREATIEAAALRLRPIVMTSLSAAAGALPLLLGTGPGSGSRRAVGVVLCAGAVFSTLLSLLVIPAAHELVERWRARRRPLGAPTVQAAE